MKQWLTTLIKLGVASGLIYWLVTSGRLDLEQLSRLNHPLIWAVGLGAFLLMFLVNCRRWQILLRFEGVEVSFPRSVRLSLIGLFFNFFVPGGVGGDVVKGSYLIRDYGEKKWFIGWSILVDRLFGVAALLFYSSLAGLFMSHRLPESLQWSFFSLSLLLIAGLSLFILIVILLPKERVANFLRRKPLFEATLLPLFYFVQRPRRGLLPFFLSLLGQGATIGLGLFLVEVLNVEVDPWVVLLIFPYGFLATVLPIAPAGIGVGQAAFFYLFERTSGQGEFGALVITFLQVIQLVVGLVGGLLFVLMKKKQDAS